MLKSILQEFGKLSSRRGCYFWKNVSLNKNNITYVNILDPGLGSKVFHKYMFVNYYVQFKAKDDLVLSQFFWPLLYLKVFLVFLQILN